MRIVSSRLPWATSDGTFASQSNKYVIVILYLLKKFSPGSSLCLTSLLPAPLRGLFLDSALQSSQHSSRGREQHSVSLAQAFVAVPCVIQRVSCSVHCARRPYHTCCLPSPSIFLTLFPFVLTTHCPVKRGQLAAASQTPRTPYL